MLRNGDIVVVSATWLERLAGAHYGHVAMVWERNGNWFTVESGPLGTRAWTYGHWRRPWVVLRPLFATTEQREGAADGALRMLGAPYHWFAFIAIAWRVLTQRKHIGMTTLQRVVCTELVVESYRLQGVDLVRGERADRVTPDLLANSEELEVIAAYNGGTT